jgi:hypothetical protein
MKRRPDLHPRPPVALGNVQNKSTAKRTALHAYGWSRHDEKAPKEPGPKSSLPKSGNAGMEIWCTNGTGGRSPV